MGDFVRAFEEKEKSKIFSGEDFDVLDSVRPLLERFQEASSMIMNADNVDGLAFCYLLFVELSFPLSAARCSKATLSLNGSINGIFNGIFSGIH